MLSLSGSLFASLSVVFSTFVIIFLSELPDKTALASLVLATRYRARDVIAGAWLAMAAQTCIAVVAGSFLTLLPAKPVHIASGLIFIAFAYLALRRKDEEEELLVEEEIKRRHPAWLASFLVVFAAEWGDLSQLAIAGLVARLGHPVLIGIGSVLALWSVMAVSVLAGSKLSGVLTPKRLNIVSGVVFAIIGLYILIEALL